MSPGTDRSDPTGRTADRDPLLSLADVEIRYGPVAAVRGVSFDVPAGEVVALLGPNGAGKTSILQAIMGVVRPAAGTISLDGDPLVGRNPETIARRGVALVPEGRHIFGDLTVEENLRLGMVGRRDPQGRDDDLQEALELFPAVAESRHRQAGLLSGGQQQQLAIARALVADPRLLLLDEPSLGLAPAIIDTVFDALDTIRSQGRTILLVEQRAARAAAFADRSHVLANGEIRLSLNERTDADAERITRAYFGA